MSKVTLSGGMAAGIATGTSGARTYKNLFLACLLSLTLILGFAPTALADDLADGAYIVGRTTSYADPETGEPVDGGTQIALGDSMCADILGEEVLVEKSNGKTYITVSCGLQKYIEGFKMEVQTTDGSYESGAYQEVETTKTKEVALDEEDQQEAPGEVEGSSGSLPDYEYHYRFEVDSTDLKFSPSFFVEPMGRDVQFFVDLDTSNPVEGTGDFVSEMVSDEPADDGEGTSDNDSDGNSDNGINATLIIIAAIVAIAVVAIVALVTRNKNKSKDAS